MHCDMKEGQQMSMEWDDMAEGEKNVVELEAWLEWETQPIKVSFTFVMRYRKYHVEYADEKTGKSSLRLETEHTEQARSFDK